MCTRVSAGVLVCSQVYCNHTDDASFTVIQRRVDGTQSFYQNWQAYKRGFGHAQGNYWAGLDTIHQLTNSGTCRG